MGSSAARKQHQLQQCFFQNDGSWFIHMPDQDIGPFDDKADAQMALMYFSLRAGWPNAKELRNFARHGD